MLVRVSLLSIASYSSYLDKLSKLFMDIGRSAPRYQTMALLYPQSNELQANLIEYYIVAVKFCHQIWKFTRKSAVSKYVSTLSDADLRTYQSDSEKWANAIKEEINNLLAKDIAGIKTVVTNESRFSFHQRNLQTKFRALDLCSTYDFQTTWKQTRKIGHCSLFFQSTDYQNWRSHTSSSTPVYKGKLGCGKSVLLANIVDDLCSWIEQNTTPVAYFFCRHDIPESLKARTILGSLTRQLLLSISNLALSRDLPDEATSYLEFEDVYSLLRRIYPQGNPVYIILDGIHECDSTTEMLLLRRLQKLQKAHLLHLCISIRLDPAKNQLLYFKEFTATRTVLIPDDNPDIEMFLDEELKNLVSSEKLKLGNPALILDIQRKLIDGSQGMFLWVVLQLQSLCAMKTDNDIRQALDQLPKDLLETFLRILHGAGGQDRAYQKRILEFIAAGFRSLTTEELREALSVVPGNTDWTPSSLINDFISTLACCGGLVIVDEEEETVRLVHHSFKQFVVGGLQGPNEGEVAIELAHRNFADTIVTYLNYGVFDTQLSVVPRLNIGTVPSQIVRDTIGSSAGRRNIALNLLKFRKQPDFDIGKVVADVSGRYDNLSQDRFHFFGYAKSFCMQHVLCASKQQLTLTRLLAQLLRKDMIDVNAKIGNNETPLTRAAANGHEVMVKLLLEANKIDVESMDEDGRTPLWWAAENGHEAIVELLLKSGNANVDAKDVSGCTPLIQAAANHEGVVKLLLETGDVDVNAKDKYSNTPMSRATAREHEGVVKLLLKTGNVDLEAKGMDCTPLSDAAGGGHEGVVKLLLETGKVDANAKDISHRTPLLRAAEYGYEGVVKVLLETDGVDVNSRDNESRTPLLAAAEHTHEGVVKLLLKKGEIDANAKDLSGRTVLSWAAEYGHEGIVKLLLETGKVDANAKDIRSRTPLLWAAENGYEGVVKAVLEMGQVDADAKDSVGRTPLSWAAENGHEGVVKLLLEMGNADVNAKDKYSHTPILRAAEYGPGGVLKLLLKTESSSSSSSSEHVAAPETSGGTLTCPYFCEESFNNHHLLK